MLERLFRELAEECKKHNNKFKEKKIDELSEEDINYILTTFREEKNK